MGIGGDSRVIGTSHRTALEYAALVNGTFGHGFTDGQKYSAKVFHPRGSPENPLSRQELEDKFLGLASMVLSRDRAKKLLHAVRNLEQMKDINELAELTVSG